MSQRYLPETLSGRTIVLVDASAGDEHITLPDPVAGTTLVVARTETSSAHLVTVAAPEGVPLDGSTGSVPIKVAAGHQRAFYARDTGGYDSWDLPDGIVRSEKLSPDLLAWILAHGGNFLVVQAVRDALGLGSAALHDVGYFDLAGSASAAQSVSAQRASNLADLASPSTARTNLGVAYGSTSGTVAQGNDSRLSNARTPTAHAATHAAAGSDPVTVTEAQVTGLVTDLALKAPLASPALTGIPTAPTAAVNTNTTQIATMAAVLAQAASAAPLGDGTAAVGTSTRFAREDHIHPKWKYAATVGNGILTAIPVTHNLGTKDVVVAVRDATTDVSSPIVSWTATDTNTVTVTFAVPPVLNSRRVVVVG